MKRQIVKRLMAKGIMVYIAVFSLVLVVAMPALAFMASSVGSLEIIDHSIKSIDIRNKAVTTDRIAPRAVKRGKIGKKAIISEHVKYLSDSKIRYQRKKRVLTIPAAAFGQGSIPYPNPPSIVSVVTTVTAPVQLPNGAKVTKVEFFVRDMGGGNKTKGELRSATDAQTGLGAFTAMAYVETPGTSASFKYISTTAIASPVINNVTKQYYVQAWAEPFPGSPAEVRQLGRARITYTIAAP